MSQHNKKLNSMIIYECLSHHVVALMLENKDTKEVFKLIKKYFSSGPLREELDIFKAIISVRGKSSEVIDRVLDEARKYSKKIDKAKLYEQKSKLSKEALSLFPKIFDYKIKNYRLYASSQLFLNECTKTIESTVNNIEAKKEIADMLKENLLEERDCSNTRYDTFVYLSAVENITSLIKELKDEQKTIVLEYLDAISSDKDINKFFSDNISSRMKLFELFKSENAELNKKLSIAKDKFLKLKEDCSICEKFKLTTLLEYCELFEEIKS